MTKKKSFIQNTYPQKTNQHLINSLLFSIVPAPNDKGGFKLNKAAALFVVHSVFREDA